MAVTWIARFKATIEEERRARQMEDFRRDTLLLQEGKRVRDERIEALAAHGFYEASEVIDER